MVAKRMPEQLSDNERQRLHRAYQRLRNASQALQALTVVEPVRGRWAATPAPPEALAAAYAEMQQSYRDLAGVLDDLLGLPGEP